MTRSSCLCGSVTWEIDGPLQFMTHCHCGRCRKAHGAAFATVVAGPQSGFRLQGREHVVCWESSPSLDRCFCARCGSVVPGKPFQGLTFLPAGNLESDPGVEPMAHIFVASKAPWFDIKDGLPQFDAYPPGVDSPVVSDLPVETARGDGLRGSCSCGGVAYRITGEPLRSVNCHCGRCRQARSAAFASNLVTALDGVQFTRGAELLVTYKVPEARHFAQVFCRVCGSPQPRQDAARNISIVPMGSLDDDPGMRPQYHIFVDSKAPWDHIADDLPQYAEYRP